VDRLVPDLLNKVEEAVHLGPEVFEAEGCVTMVM
jgi:hypothetical protein